MEISHQYDDILHLPHHVSERHAQMPMCDRAAQFSPFAALTGYDDTIAETARLTEDRRELSEERKQELSGRLFALQARLHTDPGVKLRFFQPDERKAGGAYRTLSGTVKKLDAQRRILELTDGTRIPFDDILELE